MFQPFFRHNRNLLRIYNQHKSFRLDERPNQSPHPYSLLLEEDCVEGRETYPPFFHIVWVLKNLDFPCGTPIVLLLSFRLFKDAYTDLTTILNFLLFHRTLAKH